MGECVVFALVEQGARSHDTGGKPQLPAPTCAFEATAVHHCEVLVSLFLLLWLSIPSGFLVVFEKPNRSSSTFTRCAHARMHLASRRSSATAARVASVAHALASAAARAAACWRLPSSSSSCRVSVLATAWAAMSSYSGQHCNGREGGGVVSRRLLG
jgi:hypothetical protein